jgi:outer membrane immunogenic protein
VIPVRQFIRPEVDRKLIRKRFAFTPLNGFEMFRTSLTAAASLLALSIATGASAADLPRKSVAPVFAQVPAFTWTGFYVGLNAGYGWGDFKRDVASNPVGFITSPAINAFASRTTSADGFVGGGQIGYNYQFGSVVVGLEADIQFADIKKSIGPDQIFGLPPGNRLTSSSKLEWFGTVRPRLGFAFDRFLVYATGGLAYGSVKVSDSYAFVGGPALASSSDTRFGYALGGGVEYAFTNNLTLRAEYLYLDLGKKGYASPNVVGFANTDIQHNNKTTLSVVRAAVNYKF